MLARGDGARAPVDTDFPPRTSSTTCPSAAREARGRSAFLTVQEGCDKFCAFCVVPYTRGAEVAPPARSWPRRAIWWRAGRARDHAAGPERQRLSRRRGGLARLIRELAAIEGLARIRYTTSHPNDMDDDLIAAHGEEPKLMPYLHLPVHRQSDRILKAMNRKHTAAATCAGRAHPRRAARHAAVGRFHRGLSGRDGGGFRSHPVADPRRGLRAAFSFKYSARPGTPAAEKPPVDAATADARLQALQALITTQQRAAQQAMVGREVGVLYEKPGRMPGQMVGKSDHLHAVHVADPTGQPGELVRVRITESSTNSLGGVRLAG
jgi:tRNA-2-methylthio-N6-dimethylallyladenosine synthase